jgi:Spy/CpxP family protein refolding chaperone
MRLNGILGAVLLVAVAGAPAAAQHQHGQHQQGQHQHRMGGEQGKGMHGEGACPMKAGAGAARLLSQRAELELTAEQVQRLEALAAAAAEAKHAGHAEMMQSQQALRQAAEGDAAAVRGAVDGVAKAHADRLLQDLRRQQEARAVLTAAQRAKLDELLMAGSGMDHCPMMQGGHGPGGHGPGGQGHGGQGGHEHRH